MGSVSLFPNKTPISFLKSSYQSISYKLSPFHYIHNSKNQRKPTAGHTMCRFATFLYEDCVKKWTDETTLEERLKCTSRFNKLECRDKCHIDDGDPRVAWLVFPGQCPRCNGKGRDEKQDLDTILKYDSGEETTLEETMKGKTGEKMGEKMEGKVEGKVEGKEQNAEHKPGSAGSA